MQNNYRPEIDGLRAIAVFAVIFYHAQITVLGYQPFKGGFIGVDIFFVISGYLITSIILKELNNTGKLSFKYFYERRIRRILPALIFAILISIPFAWIYLLPTNFIDFSKSSIYSLLFSSNFYFHYTGQEYQAIEGLYKPLLHTWSLSVEEQYYIIFPIILVTIFKFFKRYLGFILLIGFLISLILADWGSKNYISATFYFLHSRMWELLSGSILAYFEIQFGHRSRNKILNFIMPSIGLFLIIHSIVYFNHNTFHPSFYTLSPVLGVCLIIWFSSQNELITKILCSKLFVKIGLISYSLYLYHYIIFAFARIKNSSPSEYDKVEWIVLTIFLSIISYYLIERPFRNKNFNFKKILIIIFGIIFIILISNILVISKDGFVKRFSLISNKNYFEENKRFEINYNYDDYNSRKNVLIVGNSHGEDLLEILSLTNLTDKIYFNIASPKVRKDDYNFQLRYLLKFIKKNKAEIDYYNGDWLNHLTKQYNNAELIIIATEYTNSDLKILDELVELLKLHNKKIIIFDNALFMKQQSSFKLNRLDYYLYKNRSIPNNDELKKIERKIFKDLDNKKEINLKIKQIAKRNNLYLFEREKIFCDLVSKKCPALTDEGNKIYFDYGHITRKGAEFFAKKFEKDNLFLQYLSTTLNMSFD